MGCRVMGVDINPLMIERARERTKKQGLTDLVEFQQADAMELPFENDSFNVLITESVTAFPEDKARAIREYFRVIKPGGFIGLNEATWLRTPVPEEIHAWASQDLGANVTPLQPGEWVRLMQDAGLVDIFQCTSTISTREESRGILERYGWGGFLNSLGQAFGLYLRNPAYREFVKSIREEGLTPPDLDKYFGYGFFIGKKELFNRI